jgi:hypothetical protein
MRALLTFETTMRRLIGLSLSLLLVHVTMAGPDFACAKHGVHAARNVARPDASSHDHHGAPARSDASRDGDTSCEVPALPACCEALASCTVSLAGSPLADPGDLTRVTSGVLAGATEAPLSWILEPDPPPPKA